MRFRRSRTRRPRRLRWIEGISQTCPGPGKFTEFAIPNQATIPAQTLTDIVSAAQVENELDGNGTVMRIVGDIHLYLPFNVEAAAVSTFPIVIWLGIKALELPPSGTEATWDPSDANAQDASWMWMRTFILGTVTGRAPVAEVSAGVQYVDGYAHTERVDIRARRKLRQQQGIGLYGCGAVPTSSPTAYGATSSGVAVVANLIGNIRVLCKLS